MEPQESETEDSAAPKSSAARITPKGTGLGCPLILATVMAIAVLTLPMAPADIDMNGDVSLGAVLSYAHQHHWQFGRDIVFTYGPLGFLTFFYYTGHDLLARVASAAAVCFAASAGLSFLAWRLPHWWRWPLLSAFLFTACNLEPRTDLIMNTGLFCWALLVYLSHGRRTVQGIAILTAFVAFSSLAKASYLIPGAATIIVLALDLLVRGRRLEAGALVGFYLVFFGCGWCAAGQELGLFPLFIRNELALTNAYNQALGWEGVLGVRHMAPVLGALALGLVLLRGLTASVLPEANMAIGNDGHARRTLLFRRGLLTGWSALLVFVFWKHSFVRADFMHAGYFAAFMPVLVTGIAAVPAANRAIARWAAVLGAAGCVWSLLTLQWYLLPGWKQTIQEPARLFGQHLNVLLRPCDYLQRMHAAVEEARRTAALPEFKRIIGQSTVDFFGYCQVYAIFNDLDYHPAPVFQSYAACDTRLSRINEQFYLSAAPPEYVIFTLGPMDRKLPALDDSRVLRSLLINYKPEGSEGRFLLLKKKRQARPELTLLREGTVRPGDPIPITDFAGTNLWLEIDLQPSSAGWLRELVYRPPVVRLAAWREPSRSLLTRQRAPAANLAAGFVASPLLQRTKEVADFLQGDPTVRPAAYSLHLLPGEEYWWRAEINYRIYAITDPGDKVTKNHHPAPFDQGADLDISSAYVR